MSVYRTIGPLVEFKVHLIHSKHVPLLHNAVLICAMKELDWWPCWGYSYYKWLGDTSTVIISVYII